MGAEEGGKLVFELKLLKKIWLIVLNILNVLMTIVTEKKFDDDGN